MRFSTGLLFSTKYIIWNYWLNIYVKLQPFRYEPTFSEIAKKLSKKRAMLKIHLNIKFLSSAYRRINKDFALI